MNRRAFLAAAAGSVGVGLAGCLGGSGGSWSTNGDYPDDANHANGIPPQIGEKPAERTVNPASFETIPVNGEAVRLAPLSVAKYWYDRANTRFVDARSEAQYDRSHIYGAVNSPAQRGSTGGGIDGWPTDARVVAYCGCPHHLSSVRAAGLQKAGFSNVFVIDEGFGPWHDRGYPMAGTDFSNVQSYRLDGRTDPADAGEYAWATAVDSGQQEAAPIDTDGAYSLHLRFSDLTADTELRVETPTYTVVDTFSALASGTITG